MASAYNPDEKVVSLSVAYNSKSGTGRIVLILDNDELSVQYGETLNKRHSAINYIAGSSEGLFSANDVLLLCRRAEGK